MSIIQSDATLSQSAESEAAQWARIRAYYSDLRWHQFQQGRPRPPAATPKKPKPKSPPKPGWVYFFSDGSGVYKIGFTSRRRVEQRMFEIEHLTEKTLTVVHALRSERATVLEREIHRQFRRHKVRGEWFEMDEKCLADAIQYAEANK